MGKDGNCTTRDAGGVPRTRIGIVGGGASGALVAANLLRAGTPVHVTVFEPREVLAAGIAYSTTDPAHLLNVPACGMSAFPDDPDHFRAWAGCEPGAFVARGRYAQYLSDVLRDAAANAAEGSVLEHVRAEVTGIALGPAPRLTAVAADGATTVDVDAVVLATGHGDPVLPQAIARADLDDGVLVRDPWRPRALADVRPGDAVLVVGSGLTFVDVALSILATTPDVRIYALSRHGLMPQAHETPWRPGHPAPALADLCPSGTPRPRDVVRYVRGFGDDWRRGIDSLRSVSPALWQVFDECTRMQVARHAARYWDVHRHRMAPGVAGLFDSLIAAGGITVSSGEVTGVRMLGPRVVVERTGGDHAPDGGIRDGGIRDGSVRFGSARDGVNRDGGTRGSGVRDGRADAGWTRGGGEPLVVDRIVVCTGPTADIRRDRIGRILTDAGLAQPGPLGIGYAVDPATGAVIAADGSASARLFAVGPLRRGALWESTAIPEIRVQAAALADALLARDLEAAR